MRQLLVAILFAALLGGCALRPRYADFITAKTEGKEVTFQLLDADTKKAVPGAKIEVSELRSRINVTTAADGTFTLPVDKKLVSDNPVFVVSLPAGVLRSEVRLAPAPAPVAPVEAPPAPAAAPVEPAPVEAPPAAPEAVDAGVPSNG
jgi:nucleoid-associated protein YgaU